jgi:hypothetical protein
MTAENQSLIATSIGEAALPFVEHGTTITHASRRAGTPQGPIFRSARRSQPGHNQRSS